MPEFQIAERLLRRREVCVLVGGVDPSTLWRWQRECGFPEPVILNPSVRNPPVAWRASEVQAWMESRPRGMGRPVPRPHHQRREEPTPLVRVKLLRPELRGKLT
jgi:predicted DNA-binding transcriptional regulator AlpA